MRARGSLDAADRNPLRRLRGPGRGALERFVRGSWGDPGPGLRALATLYGVVADLRNATWEAGIFRPVRVGVPVISVGGLSTGGSGKTPLTAGLARHLADAGLPVAVVTPGQADELRLHADMNPDVPVSGGRWRIPVVRAAIAAGARAVLLDSGFQHRRLYRDFDIVALNADQAQERHRLPAGPFRERFSALRRADAVVLLRRAASRGQVAELAEEIAALAPRAHVAEVRFRSDGLRPANEAAVTVEHPAPAVAVAGVMWPEAFFRWLPAEGLRPGHRIALPDHARYDGEAAAYVAAAAGREGVVCTRKDAVRLVDALPAEVPIWWLAEAIEWESGAAKLFAGLRRVAFGGPA